MKQDMLASKFVLRHKSVGRIALQCVKLGINTNISSSFLLPPVATYKTSTFLNAKAKKDSKSADVEVTPLPDLKNADAHMERVISWLSGELAKFQVGKLGADAFGEIKVPSVGTVSNAGQLTMKGPTRLNIAVYDPELVNVVAAAIRESGFGVNPTIEGNNLLINIPKPSKEARDIMQKALSKLIEKVRITGSCQIGRYYFCINVE